MSSGATSSTAAEHAGTAFVAHRSRKRIADFRLHRPLTMGEAVAVLRDNGPTAAVMAGGVDLVNRLKFGEALSDLVLLDGIREMQGIRETADALVLGALTTHRTFEQAAPVRRALPNIAALWQRLGNIRVRGKGTFGGNVMAANPTYDVLPALLALGADLVFSDGQRVALGAMQGPPPTFDAPQNRKLLQHIELPRRVRYVAADRALRPLLSVWAALDIEEERILAGRAAIGCAFATPMACTLPFERGMKRRHLADSAAQIADFVAQAMPEPPCDANASASERRDLIAVLLRRLLARAGSDE